MTHARLRRSLLGLVLVLLFVGPLALVPSVTSSAAASTTILPAEAPAPQLATANWNGWQNLGDLNGNSVEDPVFGQNQDGRLEMLAWAHYGSGPTDYAVYRRSQTSVDGANWTGWAPLGALEPGTAGPAVATNPAGRIEVMAVGAVPLAGSCPYRTAMKQIYQTAPNNGWSSWGNMGQPSTACFLYRPFLGTNIDGRLDVFTLGSDGDFYHRWQTTPSGGWTTTWTSLGTPSSVSTKIPYQQVAVENNADGRLAIFVAAPNASDEYEIYHAWQNTAGNLSSWNTWTGFGKPSPTVQLYPPAVGKNQDGRLDVFAAGTDGNLYHKWQVAPNSYWSSGWENLGQPGTGNNVHDPKVIRTRDGRLAVFSVASDGVIWSIAQMQPNRFWGSWTALSNPPGVASFYDLAIGKNKNGSLVIAATGLYSGVLWVNYERFQVLLPLLRK